MVFTRPSRPWFLASRVQAPARNAARRDLDFGAIFAPESKPGWRTDARRAVHHRGCLLRGRIAIFRVASMSGASFWS